MSGYVRGPLPVHWHSIDNVTSGLVAPQQSSAATAWPTADLAIFSPVIVRSRVIVKQLWFASGSTGTGNYDIGLYNAAGAAVLRKGSAAKPASAAEIVWDCTDTTIGPGIYFLALACSNSTDTFASLSLTAPVPAALGIYAEAAALPLPATATMALSQTLAYVPHLGMFLDTRVT